MKLPFYQIPSRSLPYGLIYVPLPCYTPYCHSPLYIQLSGITINLTHIPHKQSHPLLYVILILSLILTSILPMIHSPTLSFNCTIHRLHFTPILIPITVLNCYLSIQHIINEITNIHWPIDQIIQLSLSFLLIIEEIPLISVLSIYRLYSLPTALIIHPFSFIIVSIPSEYSLTLCLPIHRHPLIEFPINSY